MQATLQMLVNTDMQISGEVSQGTLDALAAQGYVLQDGIVQRMPAELSKQEQEAAYRLDDGTYLYVQTSDNGYDYTLYDSNMKDLDGGQLDNPDLSMTAARDEILALHELHPSAIESISIDDFEQLQEAAEQTATQPERSFSIYQLKGGEETRDYRLSRLTVCGLWDWMCSGTITSLYIPRRWLTRNLWKIFNRRFISTTRQTLRDTPFPFPTSLCCATATPKPPITVTASALRKCRSFTAAGKDGAAMERH